jgi:hypothetical protein
VRHGKFHVKEKYFQVILGKYHVRHGKFHVREKYFQVIPGKVQIRVDELTGGRVDKWKG